MPEQMQAGMTSLCSLRKWINCAVKSAGWNQITAACVPDWIFADPKAGGSTDVSIVDKADYVYFFTDTISHSKYYQFMNIIRERKINFGYIHGVNIEKNIRDIYLDLEED